MGWQITWGGKTWRDTDLTVGHVAVILQIAGTDDWSLCDPFGGPGALMGVVTALVAVDQQRPVDSVMRELALAPMADLLGALSQPPPDDELPVSRSATMTGTATIEPGPDGGVAAVVPAVPKKPKPGKHKVGV
jgi:hypothetical protein